MKIWGNDDNEYKTDNSLKYTQKYCAIFEWLRLWKWYFQFLKEENGTNLNIKVKHNLAVFKKSAETLHKYNEQHNLNTFFEEIWWQKYEIGLDYSNVLHDWECIELWNYLVSSES